MICDFNNNQRFSSRYSSNVKLSLSSIPTTNLLFHASLSNDVSTAETGQTLSKSGSSFIFGKHLNIPCVLLNKSYFDVSPTTWIPTSGTNKSISFWFCLPFSSYRNRDGFISMGSTGYGNNSWFCIQKIENSMFFNFYNSGTNTSFSFVFEKEKWYHVVFMMGDKKIYFYINKQLVGEKAISEEAPTSQDAFRIGFHTYGSDENYYCNAYITAVRVYQKILEYYEITSLYREFAYL